MIVKWLVIGRWRETEIPVWGLRYLRFWLVKTLIQANVVVLFVGTPIYTLYLRALEPESGVGHWRSPAESRSAPTC